MSGEFTIFFPHFPILYFSFLVEVSFLNTQSHPGSKIQTGFRANNIMEEISTLNDFSYGP